MKRYMSFLLALMMTLSLAACGGADGMDENSGGGYLPTRLEQISAGGVVPEGCESTLEAQPGAYPLESLWGTWVPEDGEITTGQTFMANTAAYIDDETGEEREAVSLELKMFPYELRFAPPWNDVSTFFNTIDVYSTTLFSHGYFDMNYEETERENTMLGQALLNQNLGQGDIRYDYIEPEDASDLGFVWDEGGYLISYTISGNVLAVGLSSTNDNEAENFDILEIDYGISFSGWKLTLTYGEESVTYIPSGFDTVSMIDLEENGLEPGYESVDGILGLTHRDGISQVMYDIHEGYLDAEMTFNEDGTCSINASNGTSHQLQYLMSSSMLTLISGDDTGVYSSSRSGTYSWNTDAGTTGVGSGAAIQVNHEKFEFDAATDLQGLLDTGFTTDVDPNQPMTSCIVSEEIVLSKAGSSIRVKVVNPWDVAAPLGECKVCWVYVDDPTGTITSTDDSAIGTTSYDVIERYFEAAYEKTPNTLRYKINSRIKIRPFNFDYYEANSRECLLDTSTTEMELIYHFEEGILSAYEWNCPELLYNGLQDNVDHDALTNMDAATISGVVQVRDSVMDRLHQAFDQAGISVEIDETSGEIVMDTNVLFGHDSTELSAEGQAYIDSFMGVYASVILDESLQDVISEVRFEGHTDSSGSYDYNLELSQARADAVLAYCLSSEENTMNRAQKERLQSIASTIGYSYADLVYNEEGEEDADASRRVAIKFYVSPDSQTAGETDGSSVVEAEPDGQLTADDFLLTYEGEVFNARTEIEAANGVGNGGMWYFHHDGIDNMETARGIHGGDSIQDVQEAYGYTDIYVFDENNPFYDATNDFTSAMLDDCETFVVFFYQDTDAIAIFFDEWNCVSWIVYYMAM